MQIITQFSIESVKRIRLVRHSEDTLELQQVQEVADLTTPEQCMRNLGAYPIQTFSRPNFVYKFTLGSLHGVKQPAHGR